MGTPRASRAPLGDQVVSQSDFFMVCRCPGNALWAPSGALGRPWAFLGTTLGVTWHQKLRKKSEEGSLWCTLRFRVDFECEKGGARSRRMSLNHNKQCFSTRQMSLGKHPKVTCAASKKEHLDFFSGTFWTAWDVFDHTLGPKFPLEGGTVNVQTHREVAQPKKCPAGGPKGYTAAQAEHLWG